MKRKVSMASLKIFGKDLLGLLHIRAKMLSSCKKWMENTIPMGQSKVGYSNGTICEVFSIVICIIVHTGLFKFYCKCVLFSFFQFGPDVKAIKLKFDFNFGLVCLSQVFQSISVLKLSQSWVRFQSWNWAKGLVLVCQSYWLHSPMDEGTFRFPRDL